MASFAPSEVSRNQPVAWVTQGVLLHVEGSLSAVWNDFLAAWDGLLARPWASRLAAIRRWDEPVWKSWDATLAPLMRNQLAQHGPHRPYWKLSVADTPTFASTSIEFQDVTLTHANYPRASWLRVRLPLDTSERELFEVTRMLCDTLPVQQAVGGYLCHTHEPSRALAFDQAWAWARRYYGVHVAEPVVTSWDTVRGLWGVNWLTFVGSRWLSDDRLAGVNFDAVTAPLRSERTRHGVLLCAGKRPTVGDQNQFDDLSAYTLASQLVEPVLIEEPTPLPGMFTDQESTLLWLRRFLEPTAWRDV